MRLLPIVEDGYLRAWMATGPVVLAEVTAEFADQLATALDDQERRAIKKQIAREVRRRLNRKVPRWGLY